MVKVFYMISEPGKPCVKAAADELRAAAKKGLTALFYGILVKIAANQDGYITAFSHGGNGVIYQGWAGEFRVQP